MEKAKAQIESRGARYDNRISKEFSNVGFSLRSPSVRRTKSASIRSSGERARGSAQIFEQQSHSYADLRRQDAYIKGVDSHNKEEHLSDMDFREVFGMSKAQFRELPVPKKALLKRQAGLN